VPSFEIYKREALSRYTHLDKRRKSHRHAYRAAEIMRAPEDTGAGLKSSPTYLDRTWDREIGKVYGAALLNP
jgi:hypothetical protein